MNNVINFRSNDLKSITKLNWNIINVLLLYSCTKLSFGALTRGRMGAGGGQKKGT